MFKLVLEKAEEPEIKLPTSAGSWKKQESSRKTFLSALLTMPKLLTVWITINCGKFWKRWEYQTMWPASWKTCQVRPVNVQESIASPHTRLSCNLVMMHISHYSKAIGGVITLDYFFLNVSHAPLLLSISFLPLHGLLFLTGMIFHRTSINSSEWQCSNISSVNAERFTQADTTIPTSPLLLLFIRQNSVLWIFVCMYFHRVPGIQAVCVICLCVWTGTLHVCNTWFLNE